MLSIDVSVLFRWNVICCWHVISYVTMDHLVWIGDLHLMSSRDVIDDLDVFRAKCFIMMSIKAMMRAGTVDIMTEFTVIETC